MFFYLEDVAQRYFSWPAGKSLATRGLAFIGLDPDHKLLKYNYIH